jgi:hypothetical protein
MSACFDLPACIYSRTWGQVDAKHEIKHLLEDGPDLLAGLHSVAQDLTTHAGQIVNARWSNTEIWCALALHRGMAQTYSKKKR